MTTASAQTRKPPPQQPDLSYLLSRAFKDNPDYLLTAVKRGGYISCSACSRVAGVGASKEFAATNALREGTAQKIKDAFVCNECAGKGAE